MVQYSEMLNLQSAESVPNEQFWAPTFQCIRPDNLIQLLN